MTEQIPPHVRLRVPRHDLDLRLELLPDLAPRTAAALAAALPAAGLATSEADYGSAVCLRLPDFPGPLRAENQTVSPIPGDVLLFERGHGVDLVVFYERMGGTPAGVPFDARGDLPGNRVGAVATPLTPAVRAAARAVWTHGAAWGGAAPDGARLLDTLGDDTAGATAAIAGRRDAWHRRTRRDHRGRPAEGGRRIVLRIPEFGASTEVELAERAAPRSCEQLWANLPLETPLMHGRYSGPELFTQPGGRQWHWQPVPEHRIAYPVPGDVVLYFGPPPRLQLNYFYDRDARPYGLPRVEVGNLVGWSLGDFHAFAEAAWRVGLAGWKTLVAERPEQST
jgi:hypothetical protein